MSPLHSPMTGLLLQPRKVMSDNTETAQHYKLSGVHTSKDSPTALHTLTVH